MEFLISASYQDLFEQASSYHSFPKPTAEMLLQKMGYKTISLNAQAPIFYAGDYTKGQYLYLDPSCELLLGYNKEYIASAGQHFYNNLIHPSDYKIFNVDIFPQNIRFLKKQPLADRLNYSCSYNYRLKVRSGNYIMVLQRATYYLHPETGHPLASVGFIINITHFKEGTSIVHTIERIDRNFSTLSAEPVFKAVHYPDIKNGLLSKRESQILQLIYNGLNSKEIADRLYLSVHTINNHRKNILRKTNTSNITETIRYAQTNGLL
jgi:DNA-binding CsgD family transcriptional regulator